MISKPQKASPREPLELPVQVKIRYARETRRAIVRNISSTGAFISLPSEEIEINGKVTISLQVCGNERQIPAKVVWRNDHGYGVHFCIRNRRDQLIILDLIECVQSLRMERRDMMSNLLIKIS